MISRVKNLFVQSEAAGDLHGFYEAVIGHEPLFADGDRWVQFRVGDVSVALAGGTECVSPDRMGWAVTFEVPDLDDAVARVASLGGAIDEHRDMGSHGRAAVVRDPNGNRLVLWT